MIGRRNSRCYGRTSIIHFRVMDFLVMWMLDRRTEMGTSRERRSMENVLFEKTPVAKAYGKLSLPVVSEHRLDLVSASEVKNGL